MSVDNVAKAFAEWTGKQKWRPAFGIDGISWTGAGMHLFVVKDSRYPIPRFAVFEADDAQQACAAFEARFNETPF